MRASVRVWKRARSRLGSGRLRVFLVLLPLIGMTHGALAAGVAPVNSGVAPPAATEEPKAQRPTAPSTAAATAPQPGEVLLDKVVAVVDSHPILYSDVRAKVDKGPLVVVSEFPLKETAPAYDRALQDAINFELVMVKAKDLDIDVKDEEVEADIKSFLESRGLTREGLQEHLSSTGTTFDEYKKDFKDQMILKKFQGRVIAPQIKVTDKDIETYYLKHAGAASDLLELVLRQILIAVPAGASADVAAAKAKLAAEVHQKLADGLAFTEAVKIYSDDGSARDNGGLMAPVRAKDLSGTIRSAVEGLEVGQFSKPVKTSLGYHIFLLEEKKFAGSNDFQSKKRQLEMELRNEELLEQTRRWLSDQQQKTKVEVLPD